jgi:oleate hydratase
MVRQQHTQTPDAEDIQVWLVGGGIASLAAAVFLIKDAKVHPSHIHLFEVHSRPGGAITSSGDSATGYVLHGGRQISFHDACTKRFLSLIPSITDANKTLWNEVRDLNLEDKYQEKSSTRILVEKLTGPEKLDTQKLGLTVRDRLELLRVMLESEHTLAGKMISDVFHPEFFSTKFWMIWATTQVISLLFLVHVADNLQVRI